MDNFQISFYVYGSKHPTHTRGLRIKDPTFLVILTKIFAAEFSEFFGIGNILGAAAALLSQSVIVVYFCGLCYWEHFWCAISLSQSGALVLLQSELNIESLEYLFELVLTTNMVSIQFPCTSKHTVVRELVRPLTNFGQDGHLTLSLTDLVISSGCNLTETRLVHDLYNHSLPFLLGV